MVAFTKLCERKHAITAADMLNDRVLSFFEEPEVSRLRMLSDRDSESCGSREAHKYELYLDLEDIEHTRAKAKSPPQTNVICERFHQMVKSKFHASAFRRQIYRPIDEVQADLDEWMREYNVRRTRAGKYCYGKTPMHTIVDSMHVALDKEMDRVMPTSGPLAACRCRLSVRPNRSEDI